MVIIEMEHGGKIELELYPEHAPTSFIRDFITVSPSTELFPVL